MITVRVNGQDRTLDDGTTVADLVVSLGVGPTRVAVERNRKIVPRASLAATELADGDLVEIVYLVGGG